MVLHDLLYRAIPRVTAGELEPGLSDEDRTRVVAELQRALAVLASFGATPKEQLARMFAVPPVQGDTVASAIGRVIRGLA